MLPVRAALVPAVALLMLLASTLPVTAQSDAPIVLRLEGTEATGCNPTAAQLACFNPTEGDPATAFVAGETVQVELTAAGEAPHSVNVLMNDDASPVHALTGTAFGTAIGQSAQIEPGQTVTMEFTVPASGTLYFYCAVPDHEPIGMWFTAEIQAAGSGGTNETGNGTGNETGNGTGNETGGNSTGGNQTGGATDPTTGDGSTDAGADTNATSDDNGTAPSEEEESPGVGALALVAVLGVMAIALRRRVR